MSYLISNVRKRFISRQKLSVGQIERFRTGAPKEKVSSLALMAAPSHIWKLQVDATYKLLWLGFPVLIIGISDEDRKFHPIGLELTRDEKAEDFEFVFKSLVVGLERCGLQQLQHVDLLADAADAITKGFSNAFSNQKSFKRGKREKMRSTNWFVC